MTTPHDDPGTRQRAARPADASAAPPILLRPIGVVSSPFKVHLDAPRQPGVAPIAEGVIELRRGLQNTLKDLSGFSHLWVLFWCNFSRGWNQQVVPPRDTRKRGLFATRSPHRPNPIGLSVVELLGVRGTRLRVRGLDMLDGTPVLDLKPYVRYADSIPQATDGWLVDLPPAPHADHRDWQAARPMAKRRPTARGTGALLLALALLVPAPGCGEADQGARDERAAGAGVPGDAGPATADPEGASVLDAPIALPSKGDTAAAVPWFQQAIAARSSSRSRDAIRAFERTLELDPAHPGALIEYGFLLVEPGAEQNLGRALLLFRTARRVAPDQLHAIVGEGVARSWLGDAARAEPLLRDALARLPPESVGRRAWAQLALADLCSADGRHDEALRLYAEVAAPTIAAAQRGAALVRSADLLAQLDRPSEAEPRLRAALALDPENVRTHYLLAQLLARRPDDASRAEAAKEQRIHALLRELRDHLSTLYVKDTARRTALWQELGTVWPEHRRLPYSLLRDQLDGGDWSGAKNTAAQLLARDGRTAEACWLAARAEAGGGDLAAARRHADAMEQADPQVPPALLRTVLDDWRRGNPETVDAAAYDRAVREWLGGR